MNDTKPLMTRQEHLDWCKQRALDLLESGDVTGAFASFQGDMRKHPELENHIALPLMTELMFNGHLNSAEEMEYFIRGFN